MKGGVLLRHTELMKVEPFLKSTLWAGEGLSRRYGSEKIGEAYLLSALPDQGSVLSNGLPLEAYLRSRGYEPGDFPLLMKAIDAAIPLSVQVHPKTASHGGGKDEVWFIHEVSAKAEEAFAYIGFRRFVDEEELLFHCRRGTVLSLLNPVPVAKNDVLFIPGGTIHALSGGISLFELQQSRDVTYRLYDYGRGRPLQREQAFSVLKYTPSLPLKTTLRCGRLFENISGFPFTAEIVIIDGVYHQVETKDMVFVVLEGRGEWVSVTGCGRFNEGDCFLAPQYSVYALRSHGVILRIDCSLKTAAK